MAPYRARYPTVEAHELKDGRQLLEPGVNGGELLILDAAAFARLYEPAAALVAPTGARQAARRARKATRAPKAAKRAAPASRSAVRTQMAPKVAALSGRGLSVNAIATQLGISWGLVRKLQAANGPVKSRRSA